MRSQSVRLRGFGLTFDEVAAHLECGAPWAAGRDIPDIAGWADLVASPGAVLKCLERRLAVGRCPTVSTTVPLPKPGSDELRWMIWMDPVDELWMRILVGRVVKPIESVINRAAREAGVEVLSYRVASFVPAWQLKEHRSAYKWRRNRGLELLGRERCTGVGTLDIRQYYPSTGPDELAEALIRISVDQVTAHALREFLATSTKLGSHSGLPIGAEASGILGNLSLLGADLAAAPLTLGHIRYTDDVWLFLDREDAWEEVMETYRIVTQRQGFVLNDAKTRYHAKADGDAEAIMMNGRVDSLIASSLDGYVTPELALGELEHQAAQTTPDWTSIRFALGALARARSASGLQFLYNNLKILTEVPTSACNYVLALAEHRSHRQLVDRDWIMEIITNPRSGRTVAAKIHACRIIKRLGVGKKHGQALETLALLSGQPRNVPLQAWAATAWGRSKACKPSKAFEYACSVGDLSVRRAFALSIDPLSASSRKCRYWARHLEAVEPDLAPALEPLRQA